MQIVQIKAENGILYPDIWFDRLIKFTETCHWFVYADDGVFEMYLDNHMLQTFRQCQAAFDVYFIKNYGGKGRVWFLDLGTCVHKMIEVYYMLRRHQQFDAFKWGIELGQKVWNAMEMDFYKTHPIRKKDYEQLGGMGGFCALMVQYAQFYNIDNERLRAIGAELYFGKKKEVPLLSDHTLYSFAPFRLYLSGKIDLLIDNGNEIGPMDHKTRKSFGSRNPVIDYETQEGMTGYIFATRAMQKYFPDLKRNPSKQIWMNFLQISEVKNIADRFRRIPIFKTDEQLEEYRMRQIATASQIWNLLIHQDLRPTWNTQACANWMHGLCPLESIHRQGLKSTMFKILESDFVRETEWDPEFIDQEENKVNKVVEEEMQKCQ